MLGEKSGILSFDIVLGAVRGKAFTGWDNLNQF